MPLLYVTEICVKLRTTALQFITPPCIVICIIYTPTQILWKWSSRGGLDGRGT